MQRTVNKCRENISAQNLKPEVNTPTKSIFARLHDFLLPPQFELGYQPYVWLCYLGIYFFNYAFRRPDLEEIVMTTIAMTLFVIIYFSGFRRKSLNLVIHITAIYIIGSVMAFYNVGASVFFVYAASFCSNFKNARHGIIGIFVVAVCIGVQSYWLGLPNYFYLSAIFFSVLIGMSNLYFSEISKKNALLKQSQDEIKQLATTAERERIARDLHDLIGHTLSMLTKKAELAQKLIKVDPDKAKQEMHDVEIIARNSLSQVREAVTQYRTRDFFQELSSARGMCRAADITLEESIEQVEIRPKVSEALAFILRESMTNILRHSSADKVLIKLSQNSMSLRLQISDNGNNVRFKKGNGMLGMEERIHPLGGQVCFETSADGKGKNRGLSVIVEVPNSD